MTPASIAMLIAIVVVIFGGAVVLVKKTLDGRGKNTPESTTSSCRRSH